MSPKREFVGRGVGLALALLGLLVAGPARAQGIGSLTGTVVDASTHAPVADVVVTATAPQLQGEQVSVTDSTGTYRISQLPPGSYTLRFEKESYKPYSRSEIGLDADHTLRLNVELLPEALQSGEVVVVGKAPVIDVGSTQNGLTITSTFSNAVPISPASAGNGGVRSFSGLALAAPSVAVDSFGYSIAGTTSPENSYLIDGLNFSDTGYGVNVRNAFGGFVPAGSDFSVEFVDQVNVITGGFMPEYGRTSGGVFSVTTKSGGNEFHGSVFATWTPGFMAQRAQEVQTQNSIIGFSNTVYNAADIGFTLGGYIIKDKLWFFVGFDPSQYKNEVQRYINVFNVNPDGSQAAGTTPVPTATRNYFQTQTNYSYIAKLTYLINSDNRISLSIAGTPDTYALPAANANAAYSASGISGNDNTFDMVLRLNSSFLEKKLLLDVTLGWHHANNNQLALDGTSLNAAGGGEGSIPGVTFVSPQNLNEFPGDPALTDPNLAAICNGPNGGVQCAVNNYAQGGPGFLKTTTNDRIQGKFVLTYFLNALGHQTWKAGADVEWLSYQSDIGYSGSDAYFGYGPPSGNGQVYLSVRNVGYLSGPDQAVLEPYQNQNPTAIIPGAFIQDSWNIMDKVTLNVGVRWDSEYIFNNTGELGLALNNEWSPRIGLIWDPTYQGKSKIYASYAIYYEPVPLDLADRSLIGNESLEAFHLSGCNNPAITGRPCSVAPGPNLAGGGAGPNQYWIAIGADKELIDPGIVPETTDEVSAGAEYEIFPNARLGVNYTHRGLSRLIEDYSNNQAVSYVLGNPGYGIASSFVQPARIYNGYTVSLTKTFADHWQAQVSYTYITLNGNVDGSFSPYYGQLDPNINATYDLPQFLINGFGPLFADIQNRIKAFASYEFVFSPVWGLTLGGAYTGHSGAPISALGGDVLYGANTVFIIPRGSYGWLPWVNQFDLHATVNIGLGGDMHLSIGADCFNVIGSQQVTAVDNSWVQPGNTAVRAIPNGTVAQLKAGPLVNPSNGTAYPNSGTASPGGPMYAPNGILNANFGHATAYQAPRTFRFLARFTF